MLTAGRYALNRGVELRINWRGRLAVTPVMAAIFAGLVDGEERRHDRRDREAPPPVDPQLDPALERVPKAARHKGFSGRAGQQDGVRRRLVRTSRLRRR